MVIRSRQWFIAFVGSLLLHIALVRFLPIYQMTPLVQQGSTERSFTVQLADPDVMEQTILEEPELVQPEALQEEEKVPMVSLDEAQQQLAEAFSHVAPSDSVLEVTPGDAPDPVELEMDLGELIELTPDAGAVDGPQESDPVAVLPAQSASIAAPQPTAALQSQQMEMAALPGSESAALSGVDLSGALRPAPEKGELLIPEFEELKEIDSSAVDLPQEQILPDTVGGSEEILAEIQIEQFHFDAATMEQLPQVQAEDWRPTPPAATASESTVKKAASSESAKANQRKLKRWRSQYSGVSGINFAYRDQVRLRLREYTLYPKAVAEELEIEGKVVVGFILNRDGLLQSTEIIQSSGHSALDEAVERMVTMARFEPLPEQVNRDKVGFAFPVTVKLKQQ